MKILAAVLKSHLQACDNRVVGVRPHDMSSGQPVQARRRGRRGVRVPLHAKAEFLIGVHISIDVADSRV